MFGARKRLVWRSSEWMQRWLVGVAFTVLQGRRQMTLQSRSSRHGLLHQDDFPGLAGCGFNVPSLWYKWWKLWMSFKSFCWTQLASNAVRQRSLVSLMVSCSELVMIVRGSLRAWKVFAKSPAVNLRNCILLWNHWKISPRSSRHRRACSWSWWSWSRAKQLARWAVAWTLDLFMPCSFKYLQLSVVTVIPPHMGSAKKNDPKNSSSLGCASSSVRHRKLSRVHEVGTEACVQDQDVQAMHSSCSHFDSSSRFLSFPYWAHALNQAVSLSSCHVVQGI